MNSRSFAVLRIMQIALYTTCALTISACTSVGSWQQPAVLQPPNEPAINNLLKDELIFGGMLAEPIPDIDVAALNDEIRTLLDLEIRPIKNPQLRIIALKKLIFSPNKLGMKYSSYRTQTAIETFNSREANCLSFSILFTAMARYVGLPTEYQLVNIPASWGSYMNVWIANQHINTVTQLNHVNGRGNFLSSATQVQGYFNLLYKPKISYSSLYVADINPGITHWAGKVKIISDQEITAHYYGNLAAESLIRGELPQQAYQYAQKAIILMPDSVSAWNSIGIIYKRLHFAALAEAVFKHASQIEQFSYTSLSNLAHLYEAQGLTAEASLIRNEISNYLGKNPYYLFMQGEKEYRASNFEDAISYLKKAIHIKNDEHIFYYTLARCFSMLNETGQAVAYLKLAQTHATPAAKPRYTEKLRVIEKVSRSL